MRRLIAAIALVMTAACGSDSSTNPTTASVAGTYALSTYNNAALPIVLQASNPKVEYVSETLSLASSGSFTVSSVVRTTPTGGSPTNETYTSTGTWSLSGSTLTFSSGGEVGTATVSGNKLTLVDGTDTYVYIKQ